MVGKPSDLNQRVLGLDALTAFMNLAAILFHSHCSSLLRSMDNYLSASSICRMAEFFLKLI